MGIKMSVLESVEKLRSAVKNRTGGGFHSYVVFGVGICLAGLLLGFLALPLFSATARVEGEIVSVYRMSGYGLIYNLFSGVSISALPAGRLLIVIGGICCGGLFLLALAAFFAACCGLLGLNPRLINLQLLLSVAGAILSLVLLVCAAAVSAQGKAVYSDEFRSCSASDGFLTLTLLTSLLLAFERVVYCPEFSRKCLVQNIKWSPLLCAALSVVTLGAVMFSSAALFVTGADRCFNEYIAAVRAHDKAGIAKAFYEEGSREYAMLLAEDEEIEDLSVYEKIGYKVETKRGDYVEFKVELTLKGETDKRIIKAHLGRLFSQWYFITPFTFLEGNTYDGGFFLIENLRYDYRPSTDDYAVAGIRNTDAAQLSSLIIPATYRGKSVNAVSAHAFEGIGELTKLTVRAGVKELGEAAFKSCVNLRTKILPEDIVLGKDAF